ncbi:MAG: alpha/beta fold hydrolase [Myxococcota bacterium]
MTTTIVMLVGMALGAALAVLLVARPPPRLPPPPEPTRLELVEPEGHPNLPVPAPPPALEAPHVDERWVPLLAVVAPVAALGAWMHHQRMLSYHQHKGTSPTTRFSTWVAAETRSATRLGWWHLRAFGRDGLRIPDGSTRRTVVCVHGYSQNASNFHGLRQSLERAGYPTVGLSLGYLLAPMTWYAHRLEQKLDAQLERDGAQAIDVVAHSMGGVVLRMVLARRPDLRERIGTVITLGSPHRGTAAARGIPLLPEVRALKRRSKLLAELPQLPEMLPRARLVSIAGTADTVVYPLDTALVPGTHHVVLPGVGHAGLLASEVAWEAVRKALDAAETELTPTS